GGAHDQGQAHRAGAPPGGRGEPVLSLAREPGGQRLLTVPHQVHREVPGGADRRPIRRPVPDVERDQRRVQAGGGERRGDPSAGGPRSGAGPAGPGVGTVAPSSTSSGRRCTSTARACCGRRMTRSGKATVPARAWFGSRSRKTLSSPV